MWILFSKTSSTMSTSHLNMKSLLLSISICTLLSYWAKRRLMMCSSIVKSEEELSIWRVEGSTTEMMKMKLRMRNVPESSARKWPENSKPSLRALKKSPRTTKSYLKNHTEN